MVRKLLDLRAMLIVLAVFVGVALLAIRDLFGGAVVMLEMPHIEGGVEVTMQNIINDMRKENDGQFVLQGRDSDPEPKPEIEPHPNPERNAWDVQQELIASGGPWLS